MEDVTTITRILDRLGRKASSDGRLTVGDVVESLGERTYGPLLFLPALIGMSPVSAAPILPTLLAVIIFTTALQMVLGRRHIWIPARLLQLSVPNARFRSAISVLRPAGRCLDRWVHGRLALLMSPPFVGLAAIACMALALLVPPLELVPFATALPMAAIAIFGVSLTVKDGALMLAGLVLTTAAATVAAVTIL